MTGHDAIWARFRQVTDGAPHKPAAIDAATGQSLTYADLAEQAEAIGAELRDRAEPTIVIIGEPSLAEVAIVLACAASNRCLVPLSDREPAQRIREILQHLPGAALVGSVESLQGLAKADVGPHLANLGLQWQYWPEGRPLPRQELPFLVTHSSGSTGRPKPIAFSQSTKLRRTMQSVSMFEVSADDRILSPTPINHSLGQRHLFLAWLTGATLIKAYPFNADFWLEAVKTYRPTFAIPVATHLKILRDEDLRDPQVLSSFRTIVTSSAPAEPEFKRTILEMGDFSFWEIYGMTETACATAVRYTRDNDTTHLGSAVPGSDIRIARPSEDGSGEIEVLSDCLCDGYWGDDTGWAEALTDDGYFRSGDLGRIDSNGNLTFLGRANESFEVGGLIAFPGEIERTVLELNAVQDCVAFGLPDRIFGHVVAVAVVGVEETGGRAIIRHARNSLPKHLWPARLFFESAFPLLASGKVDRRGLAARLVAAERP